jgi:hypothetical protein
MASHSFEQGLMSHASNYKLEEGWRLVQVILSERGQQAVAMQSEVNLHTVTLWQELLQRCCISCHGQVRFSD